MVTRRVISAGTLIATAGLLPTLLAGPSFAHPNLVQQEPHVTVEIVSVELLKDNTPDDDWDEALEARLMLIAERTCKGRPAALPLPVGEPIDLLPGGEIDFSGVSLGSCIGADTDRVFFHVVLIDEDRIFPGIDSNMAAILRGTSILLENRAAELVKLDKKSKAYSRLRWTSLLAQAVVGQAVLDYFQTNDVAAELTIDLDRTQIRQANGETYTVKTKNGAARFKYAVRITNEQDEPLIGNTLEVISDVNLREGPGTDYSIVRPLSAGELVVDLGERSGPWVNIQVSDSTGWAHGDYLR